MNNKQFEKKVIEYISQLDITHQQKFILSINKALQKEEV